MITEKLENQGHIVVGFSRSTPIKCDVTDYEQVEECSRYMLDTYDGVDALITCAGTQGELGRVTETDARAWSDTIRVNLDGTYNSIRAFYPMMDQTNHPKIICFAGGGAANGRPFFSAYASAKAAVVRLVETFALEEPRVNINAIAPGAIKTNIIDGPLSVGVSKIGKDEYEKAVKQSNGGDDPLPMMELINWLLSDESNGISGRFISARWDNWKSFSKLDENIYRLRRTT